MLELQVKTKYEISLEELDNALTHGGLRLRKTHENALIKRHQDEAKQERNDNFMSVMKTLALRNMQRKGAYKVKENGR